MSLSKFESEVKHLPQPAEAAYEQFSNLLHLQALKDKLDDPNVASQVAAQVPEDKLEEVKKYVKDITFDRDSIRLNSPVGQLELRIVERDPKCIKLASEGSLVPLYVWIQILPEGDTGSKMKVTVGAEVNFFMKGMVAKPLQQAAEGLASILAASMQRPAPTA